MTIIEIMQVCFLTRFNQDSEVFENRMYNENKIMDNLK